LIFVLFYTVTKSLSPTPLILMLAGIATFISGGISKFNPFIFGGIMLEIGALLTAFVIAPEYHGLVFSASLFLGYLVPGIILRELEYDKA